MFGIVSKRFFTMAKSSFMPIRTSSLSKLRKSTGYSISNCKKALELFEDDIVKAEEWLHKEAQSKGWSQWATIQNRSATQGLIGICNRDNIAAMVEVNCETDFVAKNIDFHHFVTNVLSSCLDHMETYNLNEDILKIMLDEKQLNLIKFGFSTIGDLLGAVTCKFNEKTVVKRALGLKVSPNISLVTSSHPCTFCPNLLGGTMGKYATILAYKQTNINDENDMKHLPQNICQHIIGMNPLSLGEFTEKDLLALQNGRSQENEKEVSLEEPKETNELDESVSPEESEAFCEEVKDTNETRLLFQPYLLDTNVTVGETLFNSGIELLHFERFECGEINVDDQQMKINSVSS